MENKNDALLFEETKKRLQSLLEYTVMPYNGGIDEEDQEPQTQDGQTQNGENGMPQDAGMNGNANQMPMGSSMQGQDDMGVANTPEGFSPQFDDNTAFGGGDISNSDFDGGDVPTPEPSYKYIKHYVLMDGLGIDFGFYKTKEEIKPEPTPTGEWFIPGDINNTRPLTEEESKKNWLAFWQFFKAKGWTANAVSGILGNSFYESTVNPNRWEGDIPFAEPVASRGYGLVQWTPWTKIIDWLKDKGYYPDVSKFGPGECERIQWEMENNQQWIATATYPESFREFSVSTKDPYTLAIEFLANYERPADPNQPQRGTKAREIYDYIKDK